MEKRGISAEIDELIEEIKKDIARNDLALGKSSKTSEEGGLTLKCQLLIQNPK